MVDWSDLLSRGDVQTLIELALREDLGPGDATTQAVFSEALERRGSIITRQETVVCGVPLAAELFRRVDSSVIVDARIPEGEAASPGETLVEVHGDVRGMLGAERCALNFLQRLCGIAAAARRAVAAVPAGCAARIYDTRKTTPGWRALDKAAVRTGGAQNHRFGLWDAILIKDNHIVAAGSIGGAVARANHVARQSGRGLDFVEVEIDSLDQLAEALAAGPTMILLDNFSIEDLRTAVQRVGGQVELEVSGGVTLETIPEIARSGVDRISLGCLTHTVVPADLSLELDSGNA